MLPQQTFDDLKDAAVGQLPRSASLNLNFSLMGFYPHVRCGSKKGVASDLLAAFDRLQQECMRLLFGNGQESADRG